MRLNTYKIALKSFLFHFNLQIRTVKKQKKTI